MEYLESQLNNEQYNKISNFLTNVDSDSKRTKFNLVKKTDVKKYKDSISPDEMLSLYKYISKVTFACLLKNIGS